MMRRLEGGVARVGELEEAPELLVLEESEEEEGSDDSVVEVEEWWVEEAVGKAAAKLGLREAVDGVVREVEGRVVELEGEAADTAEVLAEVDRGVAALHRQLYSEVRWMMPGILP